MGLTRYLADKSALARPHLAPVRGACWLRLRVDYGAGAYVHDATAWRASMSGDPVRLVE